MLRVTVELLPFGDFDKKRTITVLDIWNDGTGTPQVGNYKATLIDPRNKSVQTTELMGWDRALSAWKLVAKVLSVFMDSQEETPAPRGDVAHDNPNGPCSCGAWHHDGR